MLGIADSVAIVAFATELGAPLFCVMLGGVEEARRVWAELQQRDWVNPGVDLEEIMEKLAHNWDPWSVLARYRDTDTSPIQARFLSGPRPDQELIERLRTAARAPYEEMPWPDPPRCRPGAPCR